MRKFIFIICLLLLACSVNAQAVHNGPYDAGAMRSDGSNSDIISITFNTTAGTPTYEAGKLFYDATEGVLGFMPILDGPILQIGQENWIWAYNNTGSTITNGQIVYISGAIAGTIPTASLAQADAVGTSHPMGVCTNDVANGAYGFFTTVGKCNGLNTSAFSAGDDLYLSAGTAGSFTTAIPAYPNFVVHIGKVLSSHATTGSIYVHIISSGSNVRAEFADDVNIQGKVRSAWAEITGDISASGTTRLAGPLLIGTTTDDEVHKLQVVGDSEFEGDVEVTGRLSTQSQIYDSLDGPVEGYSIKTGVADTAVQLVTGLVRNDTYQVLVTISGIVQADGINAGVGQAFTKYFYITRKTGGDVNLQVGANGFIENTADLGGAFDANVTFAITRTGAEGTTESQGMEITVVNGSATALRFSSKIVMVGRRARLLEIQ